MVDRNDRERRKNNPRIPKGFIDESMLDKGSFPTEWFKINRATNRITFTDGTGMDEIDERPTFIDIIDGFDDGGGTTTPDVPTISSVTPEFAAMVIVLTYQNNLTNFDHYELQVSDDDSSWYSLGTESDWKGTVDEWTEFRGALCVHVNIPAAGSATLPVGKLLYYRARVATSADPAVKSDWSASVSATTKVVDGGDIAGFALSAYKLDALGKQGLFFETFEQDAGWLKATTWGTNGSKAIVAGTACAGGYVAQFAGGYGEYQYPSTLYMPFDSNKIYRIQIRARRTATTDSANQEFYCGVRVYNSSGTYLDTTWCVQSAEDAYGWTLNEWQTFTGWVSGRVASGGSEAGEHADPKDPAALNENAAYFGVAYITNYNNAAVGNVMQVDYISVLAFDPDEMYRTFAGINVDGTIAANKVVASSILANCITAGHIAANTITAAQIAANTITAAQIYANTITASQIAAGTITATQLAANCVEASQIKADAVTADKISAAVLSTLLLKATALYIGYYGTYTSPAEGDRRIYVDDDELGLEEYTNGGWTTVKGIKIGGALAGLFLNLVGCGGIYNPNNPPASAERFPNPYFRVFNFDTAVGYADQNGIDDWYSKTDVVQTAITTKFGDRSLRANPSGTLGYLQSLGGGLSGNAQATCSWIYITKSGTATATGSLNMYYYYSLTDSISMTLQYVSGSTNVGIGVTVIKNSSIIKNDVTCASNLSSGWHQVAFTYDPDTDKLYTVIDGTITDYGVLGGTWGGTAWLSYNINTAYDYVVNGLTLKIFYDELVICYDSYVNPEIWLQHYTHNVAWDTTAAAADQIIRPDVDGRIMGYRQAGDTKQMLTWVPVADPTTGTFATKTSWTGTDSFVTAGSYLEIDFSSVVSVGTKDVEVWMGVPAGPQYVIAARATGDTTVSDTPIASTDYKAYIWAGISGDTGGGGRVVLPLSADYKCRLTVSNTSVDIIISYPLKEHR